MISSRPARPVWFVRSINSSFNREVFFSAAMASRNEKYIKELKNKSENENTKNNTGVVKERFQKVGERKKLASKFRRVRERCPRPTIVAFPVKHSEIQ